MSTADSIAVPGFILGVEGKEYSAGKGTYIDENNNIRATLLGNISIEKGAKGAKDVIHVITPFRTTKDIILEIGDTVDGRILKTNYNQAFVEIFSVKDDLLPIPAKGVIHREDVRSKEIDKVVIHEFFKSGDIVRATVVSLGDYKHYFLSTADDNLGVIPSLNEKVHT